MNTYMTQNIGNLINGNPYVGRGIIIGKSSDGKSAVSSYFIMGRSDNSRNRIFVCKNKELYTQPFDISKVEDPSLIIYCAVKSFKNKLIVTNGDQTDTIYDFLKNNDTFEHALCIRQFEPDAPNFTPRISGMLTFENKDFSYVMSILKSSDEVGSACSRYTFNYPSIPGVGHFIHTYITDGNPIPTFTGEPERISIPNSIEEFTDDLWNNLDDNNKISVYVRYTDINSGKFKDKLINKRMENI